MKGTEFMEWFSEAQALVSHFSNNQGRIQDVERAGGLLLCNRAANYSRGLALLKGAMKSLAKDVASEGSRSDMLESQRSLKETLHLVDELDQTLKSITLYPSELRDIIQRFRLSLRSSPMAASKRRVRDSFSDVQTKILSMAAILVIPPLRAIFIEAERLLNEIEPRVSNLIALDDAAFKSAFSEPPRTGEAPVEVVQVQSVGALPRYLLHPKLAGVAWDNLQKGAHDTAVLDAAREVEVAVRIAGAYPETLIGTSLMREAFGATGPLIDTSVADKQERESPGHLFAGFIGMYKNPHSHRRVGITEPLEAFDILLLASHLLRIVERRVPLEPPIVYVGPKSKVYHPDRCSHLKTRRPVSLKAVKAKGFHPCSKCPPELQ